MQGDRRSITPQKRCVQRHRHRLLIKNLGAGLAEYLRQAVFWFGQGLRYHHFWNLFLLRYRKGRVVRPLRHIGKSDRRAFASVSDEGLDATNRGLFVQGQQSWEIEARLLIVIKLHAKVRLLVFCHLSEVRPTEHPVRTLAILEGEFAVFVNEMSVFSDNVIRLRRQSIHIKCHLFIADRFIGILGQR